MYLISDPMPTEEVDYFIIDIDGTTYNSEAELNGDGSESRCHFEIPDDLPNGTHTATITAVNAWGTGEPSDPFVFAKASPSKPSGIGLSAD